MARENSLVRFRRCKARKRNHGEDAIDVLRAMHDEWEDYGFINKLGGYDNHNMRRARDVLRKAGVSFSPDRSKPATKTVQVYRLEFAKRHHVTGDWLADGETWPSREYLDDKADELRGDPNYACIRVTGPHTQEIPA